MMKKTPYKHSSGSRGCFSGGTHRPLTNSFKLLYKKRKKKNRKAHVENECKSPEPLNPPLSSRRAPAQSMQTVPKYVPTCHISTGRTGSRMGLHSSPGPIVVGRLHVHTRGIDIHTRTVVAIVQCVISPGRSSHSNRLLGETKKKGIVEFL